MTMTTEMFDLTMYQMLQRNLTQEEASFVVDYCADDYLVKENNLLVMFADVYDLGCAGAALVKDCDPRFHDLCDEIHAMGLRMRERNLKEIDKARERNYHEYYVAGYTVLDKKMGDKCDECGSYTIHYIAYKEGVTSFMSFDLCEDCDDTVYDVLDPEATGGIII